MISSFDCGQIKQQTMAEYAYEGIIVYRPTVAKNIQNTQRDHRPTVAYHVSY